MLEALDYLAFRSIIHRDVKPANILYDLNGNDEDRYHFQLTDFGFAESSTLATSYCGTTIYMAPEMHRSTKKQTTKIDIWSLFATLVSLARVSALTDRFGGSYEEILEILRNTAKEIPIFQPMAQEDPAQRYSAAQMLVQEFGGTGLTTPHEEVVLPVADLYDGPIDAAATPETSHYTTSELQIPLGYSIATTIPIRYYSCTSGINKCRGYTGDRK